MRKWLQKIFNWKAIETSSRRTVGSLAILLGLVGL